MKIIPEGFQHGTQIDANTSKNIVSTGTKTNMEITQKQFWSIEDM